MGIMCGKRNKPRAIFSGVQRLFPEQEKPGSCVVVGTSVNINIKI